METHERQDLIKELLAQNASDSMDVFGGATWNDMCAILAEEYPDARIERMRKLGMIDAELDGMSAEEMIVAADDAILMTMSDMLRKRSEMLHTLALRIRLAALQDVLAAKLRRGGKA